MSRLVPLVPLALAALIAGCGSSSTSSTSTAASSTRAAASATTSSASNGAGSQLTLSESEFKITPASPSIAKTGTVTITVKNTGAVTHALSVQTPSGVVRTSDISPGSSATLTVDATKAGRYTFFCPIDGHRASGMQGVLVVGSAKASTGGAGTSSGVSSTPTGGSGY